mmetsp:Transcript_19281/g.16118  ORF Transcript_19281/g.16118 Transcript_19281/m.16118 type:complete len:107 (-) Transcript_19281:3-323(-)
MLLLLLLPPAVSASAGGNTPCSLLRYVLAFLEVSYYGNVYGAVAIVADRCLFVLSIGYIACSYARCGIEKWSYCLVRNIIVIIHGKPVQSYFIELRYPHNCLVSWC